MGKALRGVNLGGWLVAERWMTPRLFDGIDDDGEIAIVRELGYEKARERLTAHRDTFITEKDFRWLAEQKYDFVRLPIGFWLFEHTDDFIDGERYIKETFRWATQHGLKVVLDFHGLQGSQNGQDHSGQVGRVELYRPTNRSASLRTLEYIAKIYGQEPALLGIELINEPKVRCIWRLLRYYDEAYRITERFVAPGVKIIVSDAFKPLRMARALSKRGYGARLVLDIHLYQVFSRTDKKQSVEEHIDKVQNEWKDLLSKTSQYVPIYVGEWSAALPGEAFKKDRLNESRKTKDYFDAQQTCFEMNAWAHSYWSYKAPGNGAWSLRDRPDLINNGEK
jgi:glucan 1,3-beta-glucosidase